MEATIGIIVTVVILFFVIFVIFRDWTSTWEGKLVDKKEVYESDEEGYKQKKRKLYFETSEGKSRVSVVSRRTYKSANVGDSYKKVKYSFKPKRV